jgi:hypothetical protein
VKKGTSAVRVFPHEGKWLVGCGAGYYNYPMMKEEAIERACAIARSRSASDGEPVGVEIHDELGKVIGVVEVSSEDHARAAATPKPSRDRSDTATVGEMFAQMRRGMWPQA